MEISAAGNDPLQQEYPMIQEKGDNLGEYLRRPEQKGHGAAGRPDVCQGNREQGVSFQEEQSMGKKCQLCPWKQEDAGNPG